MSKIMQNLVVFMEPSEHAYDTPAKAGNMILNRFCIDEDAAFELSGISSLETFFWKHSEISSFRRGSLSFKYVSKEKGKDYSE